MRVHACVHAYVCVRACVCEGMLVCMNAKCVSNLGNNNVEIKFRYKMCPGGCCTQTCTLNEGYGQERK